MTWLKWAWFATFTFTAVLYGAAALFDTALRRRRHGRLMAAGASASSAILAAWIWAGLANLLLGLPQQHNSVGLVFSSALTALAVLTPLVLIMWSVGHAVHLVTQRGRRDQ